MKFIPLIHQGFKTLITKSAKIFSGTQAILLSVRVTHTKLHVNNNFCTCASKL